MAVKQTVTKPNTISVKVTDYVNGTAITKKTESTPQPNATSASTGKPIYIAPPAPTPPKKSGGGGGGGSSSSSTTGGFSTIAGESVLVTPGGTVVGSAATPKPNSSSGGNTLFGQSSSTNNSFTQSSGTNSKALLPINYQNQNKPLNQNNAYNFFGQVNKARKDYQFATPEQYNTLTNPDLFKRPTTIQKENRRQNDINAQIERDSADLNAKNTAYEKNLARYEEAQANQDATLQYYKNKYGTNSDGSINVPTKAVEDNINKNQDKVNTLLSNLTKQNTALNSQVSLYNQGLSNQESSNAKKEADKNRLNQNAIVHFGNRAQEDANTSLYGVATIAGTLALRPKQGYKMIEETYTSLPGEFVKDPVGTSGSLAGQSVVFGFLGGGLGGKAGTIEKTSRIKNFAGETVEVTRKVPKPLPIEKARNFEIGRSKISLKKVGEGEYLGRTTVNTYEVNAAGKRIRKVDTQTFSGIKAFGETPEEARGFISKSISDTINRGGNTKSLSKSEMRFILDEEAGASGVQAVSGRVQGTSTKTGREVTQTDLLTGRVTTKTSKFRNPKTNIVEGSFFGIAGKERPAFGNFGREQQYVGKERKVISSELNQISNFNAREQSVSNLLFDDARRPKAKSKFPRREESINNLFLRQSEAKARINKSGGKANVFIAEDRYVNIDTFGSLESPMQKANRPKSRVKSEPLSFEYLRDEEPQRDLITGRPVEKSQGQILERTKTLTEREREKLSVVAETQADILAKEKVQARIDEASLRERNRFEKNEERNRFNEERVREKTRQKAGALSLLSERFRLTQREASALKSRQRQSSITNVAQTNKSRFDSITASFQRVETGQRSGQAQVQPQVQRPGQIGIFTPVPFIPQPRPPQPPKPEPKRPEDKKPIIPVGDDYTSKKKKIPGYYGEAKSGNKWVRVNTKPLERTAAFGKALSVVDNTTSKNARIVLARKKINNPRREDQTFALLRPKFRDFKQTRGSRTNISNQLIEKQKFAVDTSGEKNRLNANSVLSRRRSSHQKNFFGF